MTTIKNKTARKRFFLFKTLVFLIFWQIEGCAQNEKSSKSSQKPNPSPKEASQHESVDKEMKMIPTDPEPGEKVRFHYILGYYKNTCVPQFETQVNTKPIQVNCVTSPCPQQFIVELQYEIVKRPDEEPGVMCGQALTKYGPKFTLYDIKPGIYTVKHKGRKIFDFSVKEKS